MNKIAKRTMDKFRIALCQNLVTKDKHQNIAKAQQKIHEAASQGAQIVVLPECFNSPYGNDFFPSYAEDVSGGPETSPTLRAMAAAARDARVHLIAGSIPTRDTHTGKLYNTCTVFDAQGVMVASYRKMHLFDVNVEGGISFQESKTLSAGNSLTTVFIPLVTQNGANDVSNVANIVSKEKSVESGATVANVVSEKGVASVPSEKKSVESGAPILSGKDIASSNSGVKIGLGICFDIRFSQLAALYMQHECDMLVYPGAFNMTTGPLHWELLIRTRALDNQMFVAMCSPARDESAPYVAYGHSMVADPMGKIVARADEKETILYADVDVASIAKARQQIPTVKNRRLDVYETIEKM